MLGNKEPYVIQGSAAPAFIMHGATGSLVCGGCQGSALIEGYKPENFISVRIKCFACGEITSTPGLHPGEILPSNILSLGADGRFLLGTPVVVAEQTVVTCDTEIEIEQSRTRPKKFLPENISLDFDLVDQVEGDFGRLIGENALQKQRSSVRRAMKHGDLGAEEFPLAWACVWLRERLLKGASPLSLDAPAVAAITSLLAFRHFTAAWGHHPRFSTIGQSFAGARIFHHNIAQFAAASYLFDHGNRIGLAIPEGGSQRTADLYTRLTPGEIFHIEAKAPLALQWPNVEPAGRQAIGRIVLNALSSAKGQLNRRKKGVLVVAANTYRSGFDQRFREAIESLIHAKGRDYRGVAAVVGVVPLLAAEGSPLRLTHGYAFVPIRNPHFDGENPVRIGD